MSRVLIAGCGDVGGALGRALLADGHEVFGLRRDVAALPPGLVPVAADLSSPASLRAALPRSIDAVVYTAAASGRDDEAYRLAYVAGPRHLLDTIDRDRLTRLLFVSSTGVYGQDDGSWVDETSPTTPGRFSGRRLLEGEAAVAASGVDSVVVRFGGIYGPGRTRLVERVRAGAACREQPPAWTNRIHRDDCAGVLRHLLGLRSPHPVYLGVDCEPAPQCAVMDWLAARLGVAPPARDAAGEPGRGGNKRCRNARLLASGYRFAFPTFREGYARVLDDL